MEEIWKETEYKGYFISNLGRLKGRTGKILKQHIGKTGYYIVSISPYGRQGKSICLKIHRVVAKAFLSNENNYPIINHKEGNKLNNNVDNLEWCTYSHNTQHAFNMGLEQAIKGCDNSQSKLTNDDVIWIREHYIPGDKTYGARALARKFNMNHSNISRLINKIKYRPH